MKFTSLALSALTFALPSFSQTLHKLTYSTAYDQGDLSLDYVACSNGENGLVTKGYTTLSSLPNFPNVGGVYTVHEWDSPACGTCYNVTDPRTNVSISILAVDIAGDGFNLSEEAMNTLTGGQAETLGRSEVTASEVDPSYCFM